jgi:hypothetical protein
MQTEIAICYSYQFTELWSVELRGNNTLYENHKETGFQNLDKSPGQPPCKKKLIKPIFKLKAN